MQASSGFWILKRIFMSGLLRINLRGRVDEDGPISADVVRSALAESRGHDRILVDLDTAGGNADAAFEIYDCLRAQTIPVAAIAGQCHSAGLVIFLSAALRIAKPDATFLLHPLTVDADKLSPVLTIKSLRDLARRLEVKHNRGINLLADRTGYDRAWFCDEAETEEIMDVAAAIDCGLVHAIAGTKGPCNPDWPIAAKRIKAEERQVVLPQHLMSPNFFESCRVRAHFAADELG
jgi:ATP-dependent protease ClpP protease subunit